MSTINLTPDQRAQRAALGLEPTPKAPKQRRKVTLPLLAGSIIAAVTLMASCGAGMAMGTTETVPGPVQTVPGKTVTKEVKVEVAAPSCIRALDIADKGFDHASKTILEVPKLIDAILASDVGAMEDITAEVQRHSAWFEKNASKYNAAKVDCRAAAE